MTAPTPRPAGYSGTPLPRKLGIGEGAVVALVGAPDGFEDGSLAPLPAGVTVRRRAQGHVDVAVWFVTRRADLERRMPAMDAFCGERRLWVAWPKKASGVATDVTEDVVRAVALPLGLVDYKVCAIDQTWSGLCLTRRKSRR